MDIKVRNEGSVVMFECCTEAGRHWVCKNVVTEGWQWFGPSFAVDHRIAFGLRDAMESDGLVVS